MHIVNIILTLFFLLSNGIGEKTKKPKNSLRPPVVKTNHGKVYKSIQNGVGPLSYYSFNNIRYGQVKSRFSEAAPECNKSHKSCRKASATSKSTLLDNRIPDHPKCPQAAPDWLVKNSQAFRALSRNQSAGNFKALGRAESVTSKYIDTIRIPDDENEDCLFLDVLVPKNVWDKTQAHPELGYAPVVVRIHDGGFAFGDKSLQQDPTPLFNRSLEVGSGGMIVVSINYRLGLFGFLSGDPELVFNVGLLDQRMALGWIQTNIQKFGGDRFRVSVIGQGAGAASILHHVTAPNITKNLAPLVHPPSGYQRKFAFRSAIVHSPTFQPMIPSQSKANLAKVFAVTSALAGRKIENIHDLRQLPYKILYIANLLIIHGSAYGTFSFGPVVDVGKNSYVPDFPLRRLDAGLLPEEINIFVGHMRNEGRFFVPDTTLNDTDFSMIIRHMLPTVPQRDIDYIVNSLYPSFEYVIPSESGQNRSIEAIDDLLISCNVYYLAKLIKNAFGYLIDVPTKTRDQVLEKIFFAGTVEDNMTKTDIFQTFQTELIQFVIYSLQGAQFAKLRRYHSDRGGGDVLRISNNDVSSYIRDPCAKRKCDYWADVPYELAP